MDEIIAPSGVNAAALSGTVEMCLSGSMLTIILKNTSGDSAGSGAGVLLTGLGFNLPTGVAISGGSANMGSSMAVNFMKPSDGNVSQEWGYDNDPLKSGAFLGHSVNTAVSCMESQTELQFQAGSLVPPPNLNGPDMGLLSALETDSLGDGVEAIKDMLTIKVNLSGTVPSGLLASIESGNVALTFGSPGEATSVADSGNTLVLLGSTLTALGLFARRRRLASKV